MAKRLLLAFALLFCVFSAQARWSPQYADSSPAVQKWFKTQHNSTGQWCCDESDGHRFEGNYEFTADGSVIAWDNGQKYLIEKSKVLTGHNPTGSAIWWFIEFEGGRRSYCFSAGSLS